MALLTRRRLRPVLASATALVTAGVALALVPTGTAATKATTVQVSVRTGGFAPGWGTNTEGAALSRDGRYAVLAASGPLVPGQPQIQFQIIRRDRHLGTSQLISKSTGGAMGAGNSYDPAVSADGNVIAFRSEAANLVPGDTNNDSDIFVHDVRTGVTKRVSVSSTGAQTDVTGAGNPVGAPSISADGRFVGFTSTAEGLTSDDKPGAHAYLHDLRTGTTEVVSRTAAGVVVPGHVSTPVSVSANGDFVTFQTLQNGVTGGSNTSINVYVRDRRTGQQTTTAVGGKEHRDLRQTISPNGRFVVYDTGDNDQVPNDTNDRTDVFVHDRVAGTYDLVSVASNGAQGNGHSYHGSISDDGRYVTFLSTATNLVPGDTNGQADIFRHDRTTGQTIRVNVHDTTGAQTTASTLNPSMSGDGQHVAFGSYTRLSAAETSGYAQTYVRDFAGKYPALFAAIPRLPARVNANSSGKVATRDIRTGPALEITWKPIGKTKGKTVVQRAAVSNNAFTLKALGPGRAGQYEVTVTYAGNVVIRSTVRVVRPAVTKMPKQAKRNKRVNVRTTGIDQGKKVNVRFVPRGKTKGKRVNRTARVNAKGVVKVKAAPRKGTFRIVVRHGGKVLKKGPIRIR